MENRENATSTPFQVSKFVLSVLRDTGSGYDGDKVQERRTENWNWEWREKWTSEDNTWMGERDWRLEREWCWTKSVCLLLKEIV